MATELYERHRPLGIGFYACASPLVAGFGLSHFFSEAHSQMDVNVTSVGGALMFSGLISTAIARHAFDHERDLSNIFRSKSVRAGLCAAALVGGVFGYGVASDNLSENTQLLSARLISSETPITRSAGELYCDYTNQGEEVLVKDNQNHTVKIQCPDKMPS
jgi:hypothetical protein